MKEITESFEYAKKVFGDAQERTVFQQRLAEEAPLFWAEMREMRYEYVDLMDPPLPRPEQMSAGDEFTRLTLFLIAELCEANDGKIPNIPRDLLREVHWDCNKDAVVLERYDTLSSIGLEWMTHFMGIASQARLYPHGRAHIFALAFAFMIAAEREGESETIAADVARGTAILESTFPKDEVDEDFS